MVKICGNLKMLVRSCEDMAEKISLSVDEEMLERVERRAEEDYDGNKSKAARELIELGLEAEGRVDELEAEKERLEERIGTLVSTNERLSRLLEED